MFFIFSIVAAAACPNLDLPIEPGETYAIAGAKCDPTLTQACATFEAELVACVMQKKGKVVSQKGAAFAVDEATFGAASSDDLNKLGQRLGSKRVFLLDVHLVDKIPVALCKLVDTESGAVIAVTRLGAKAEDASKGSLDSALRELATKLERAISALPGKKKTLAVMTLNEGGEAAKKNGLGTIVSAELTTRFKRDHGMAIVERSRLDQVLREIELGQAGVLDPKSAPTLGKMLGADAVIFGTVNDAGATTKVYAQVVDVLSGATLVAESVDFKSADLVALSSDAVVLRTKSGAVFRSLLIPGWGQLYNRQPVKGYVLLVSVLALAGAGAGLEIGSSLAADAYRAAPAGSGFDALAVRSETLALAGVITFAVMGAVWIYNIIDAYVNGFTYDSAVDVNASGSRALSRF